MDNQSGLILIPTKHSDEETVRSCIELSCTECGAEYSAPGDLKAHYYRVHFLTDPDCFCVLCKNTLRSWDHYARHLLQKHVTELFPCKQCCSIFKSEAMLRSHIIHHQKLNDFVSCSQCPSFFLDMNNLIIHEELRHSTPANGINIKRCLPHLSSYLNMKVKDFFKAMATSNSFQCMKCNLVETNVKTYIKHLKIQKCRSAACNRCGDIFPNKRNLKLHLRNLECAKESTEKIVCDKCNSKYDNNEFLSHTKTCRPKITCKLCKSMFEDAVEMSEHYKEVHCPVLNINKCNYCQIECVGNEGLKKHIKACHKDTHLYKYHCYICKDILFKHPKRLFAHFYTRHQDIEPYQCKICDKNFRIRKKFTLHIKLVHKSVGSVEYDLNFHVSFTNKKTVEKSASSDPDDKNHKECDEDTVASNNGERLTENVNTENKTVGDITTDKTVDNCSIETIDVPSNIELNSKNIQNETLEVVEVANEDISKTNEADNSVVDNTEASNETEEYLEEIEYLESSEEEAEMGAEDSEMEQEETEIEFLQEETEFLEELCKTNNDEIYSSDDNVPINYLLKRKRRSIRKKAAKTKEKGFICSKCNKNCYTYQNFTRHKTLHSKESKQCIKCERLFRTVTELKTHYEQKHTKSKLTEKLHELLEIRKIKNKYNIQSVKIDKNIFSTPVKVTEVFEKTNQPIKTYLERFTNDLGLREPHVVIRCVKSPVETKPGIKLTKINFQKSVFKGLTRPKPFNVVETEKTPVKVEVVHRDVPLPRPKLNFGRKFASFTEDLSSENSVEFELNISDVKRDFSIDNNDILKKNCNDNCKIPENIDDIHVALLVSEPPYYKIVKVGDINNLPSKNESKVLEKQNLVTLPKGVKLVNVNPLKHLLRGRKFTTKNVNTKKPKTKDTKLMVAKAYADIVAFKKNK